MFSEQFYPKFLNMTKYRVVIFKKNAYHPCRNADLNVILFAATINGFICDPPQEFDAKGKSTRTTRLHDTLSVP